MARSAAALCVEIAAMNAFSFATRASAHRALSSSPLAASAALEKMPGVARRSTFHAISRALSRCHAAPTAVLSAATTVLVLLARSRPCTSALVGRQRSREFAPRVSFDVAGLVMGFFIAGSTNAVVVVILDPAGLVLCKVGELVLVGRRSTRGFHVTRMCQLAVRHARRC